MNLIKKLLSMMCVALSVYLLMLGQAFGAGETIITHGYLPDNNSGIPTWVRAMSDATETQIRSASGCALLPDNERLKGLKYGNTPNKVLDEMCIIANKEKSK